MAMGWEIRWPVEAKPRQVALQVHAALLAALGTVPKHKNIRIGAQF